MQHYWLFKSFSVGPYTGITIYRKTFPKWESFWYWLLTPSRRRENPKITLTRMNEMTNKKYIENFQGGDNFFDVILYRHCTSLAAFNKCNEWFPSWLYWLNYWIVLRYDTLARHILINKTYNDVIEILSPLKHIMM